MIKKKYKKLIILGIILLFVGCSIESTNTPKEIFEYIIEKPIPHYISNLEGGGYTWHGYSIYLRFMATEDFIKILKEKGYKDTGWNDISYRFQLPKEFHKLFSKTWNPSDIQNKKCFEKNVQNSWTGGGSHYFVYNINNSEIYFYGVGS